MPIYYYSESFSCWNMLYWTVIIFYNYKLKPDNPQPQNRVPRPQILHVHMQNLYKRSAGCHCNTFYNGSNTTVRKCDILYKTLTQSCLNVIVDLKRVRTLNVSSLFDMTYSTLFFPCSWILQLSGNFQFYRKISAIFMNYN